MSHSQKYKVFVNEKLLTISEEPEMEKNELRVLNLQYDGPQLLKFYLDQFRLDCYHHLHLFGEHPEVIFQDLCNEFTLIEAAGGLVINDDNEALVIFRKGKWDLPKGKIDEGETPESAAVREVAEECSIQLPNITGSLGETWHTYQLNGKAILKKTYWYKMIPTHGKEQPRPQTEEDISEAKWVGKDYFDEMKKNIFPAIEEIMKNFWLNR